MHEVHTARKIARMALSTAKSQGRSTFKGVRVRIGAWTGIDVEHLKHDFETVAPGVDLQVEVVEPSARCEDCGSSFQPDSATLACSVCGSRKVRLLQTRDIEVVHIDC